MLLSNFCKQAAQPQVDKYTNTQEHKYTGTQIHEACLVGCFRKTLFQENEKYNPPSNSLGVSLMRSKRIFDFDKVLGCL